MLGVTRKTLREMEARGELPPRVSFSAKVFGWRLADMEALIRDRMGCRLLPDPSCAPLPGHKQGAGRFGP